MTQILTQTSSMTVYLVGHCTTQCPTQSQKWVELKVVFPQLIGGWWVCWCPLLVYITVPGHQHPTLGKDFLGATHTPVKVPNVMGQPLLL